jgi:hypothetical protein
MSMFLGTMGEVFSEDETHEFMVYALELKKPGETHKVSKDQVDSAALIDIKRVVDILMPRISIFDY